MSVAALVLAAGRGERLGHAVPKGFVPLAGRPLFVHALERLSRVAEIDVLIPVVASDELPRYRAEAARLGHLEKLAPPIAGGAERQDSVRAGLAALPPGSELVAVHDAARALIRPEDVSRVIAAARRSGAAILATRVRDTIKRVRAGRVVATPDRAECWAAQTPQVFRAALLREAMEKATAEGRLGTDDAQLVEWLGAEVAVVEGDPGNLKITLPEDLAAAERLLAAESAARPPEDA